MSLLSVRDLQAGYGKVEVLFNGHIEVEPGELVGIVGPNGAGKSTFLGAMAGSVKPSSGCIEFEGVSIRGKKPEDIVRLGLALVPEGRAIFTDLTVNENLLLGLTGRRDKSGSAKALAEATSYSCAKHSSGPTGWVTQRWATATARHCPSTSLRAETFDVG